MAYNILSRTDRALAAYIISESAGSSADVFPAKRLPDQTAFNYTVCFSESGRPTVPYSGSFTVKARVDVITRMDFDRFTDDPDNVTEDWEDRVGKTFDAFHVQRDGDQGGHYLGELITAAARATSDPDLQDFTVLEAIVEELESGRSDKDGEWIDTLNLSLVVVPANVS